MIWSIDTGGIFQACAGPVQKTAFTASISRQAFRVKDNTLPSMAHSRMTADEKRSSFSLAFIFALRMLGLFLVLPVFSLSAQTYEGGNNTALIGLAMGAYGLTQAFLQLPLGIASDRFGRKRMIVLGLLVFAAGSAVAALADSVWGLVIGRAIQGAGAISAATTALLSDQTRDVVRTKAMALIGISIGMVFATALVLGPLLTSHIGLSGLFWLTAALALAGIAVVVWLTPAETPPSHTVDATLGQGNFLLRLWQQPELLRLNTGVFVLHAVQMAMWSAIPGLLLSAGLAQPNHWQIYLPTVMLSILFLGPLFSLERRGHLRLAALLSIGLILVAQIMFGIASATHASLWAIGIILVVFFCGFNAMEALQPSQVSRMAPAAMRGAALGAYSTLQSLGLFAGGAMGGLLMQQTGATGLFLATTGLAVFWFWTSWSLHTQQGTQEKN